MPQGFRFDLLLTDIVMPGMDGIDSPSALRSGTQPSRSCSSPALRRGVASLLAGARGEGSL